MDWIIKIDKKAKKQLKKLGKPEQKQLDLFITNTMAKLVDPRLAGKQLTGNHKGLWSYRTGNYRVICKIKDRELVVLVVRIGHRSYVYN